MSAPVYDLERARRTLDQDGWAAGPDGVRVKNGRRLAFTLTTTSDQQLRATERDIVVSGWRKLGADVTSRDFPVAALFGSFDQGGVLARGQYEAALWSWLVPPDPDSEFGIFHSSGHRARTTRAARILWWTRRWSPAGRRWTRRSGAPPTALSRWPTPGLAASCLCTGA